MSKNFENPVAHFVKYPNNDKETFVLQNENSTALETLLGLLSVGSFIIIWISSLMSPILLFLCIKHQNYTGTTIILSVTAAAYLPWNARSSKLKHIVQSFISHYHPLYYKKCTVLFKGLLPTDEQSQNSKPLFYAIHPHGAFCLGWSVLFASDVMENVRFCFSPALYYSPFFKLFCLLTGKPGKADKSSMISYMKQGENIALPPGGFEEATITSTLHDRVYIRKRVGFVKLCLQHGYSIVPTYCFGEKSTFANVQGLWKFRLWLNSLGIPAIVIWGNTCFGLLPKRSKDGLYIVTGETIEVPKIENPTREDVKKWHDKYMSELLKIFEDHKCDAYGEEGKTVTLEMW